MYEWGDGDMVESFGAMDKLIIAQSRYTHFTCDISLKPSTLLIRTLSGYCSFRFFSVFIYQKAHILVHLLVKVYSKKNNLLTQPMQSCSKTRTAVAPLARPVAVFRL